VSLLPHVRHWDAELLRGDDRFVVTPYSMPVTHVLQFNSASKPLRIRQLRGALVYALDRQRILAETVLRGPDAGPDAEQKQGRVVSAPWLSSGYAYNTLVKPREYDLALAFSLAVATKRALGGEIPQLKMICAPNPTVELAAAEIVRQWARIGVNVQILTDSGEPAQTPEDWDILYHTVRMVEPLVDLWPFLTFDTRARVRSLAHLPDWLRQQMVELDNAGDWSSALTILHRLHRQLWSEVQVIPLWEVNEFTVIRKNIARTLHSSQRRPMHVYQGIERWIVRP
jgi:ABC-type transport system substrate-binding protein